MIFEHFNLTNAIFLTLSSIPLLCGIYSWIILLFFPNYYYLNPRFHDTNCIDVEYVEFKKPRNLLEDIL